MIKPSVICFSIAVVLAGLSFSPLLVYKEVNYVKGIGLKDVAYPGETGLHHYLVFGQSEGTPSIKPEDYRLVQLYSLDSVPTNATLVVKYRVSVDEATIENAPYMAQIGVYLVDKSMWNAYNSLNWGQSVSDVLYEPTDVQQVGVIIVDKTGYQLQYGWYVKEGSYSFGLPVDNKYIVLFRELTQPPYSYGPLQIWQIFVDLRYNYIVGEYPCSKLYGYVTAENGQPLENVYVSTSYGYYYTSENGYYEILVPDMKDTQVSFIKEGYETYTTTVKIVEDTELNVILKVKPLIATKTALRYGALGFGITGLICIPIESKKRGGRI
jgi:hypothetical protein